MVKIKKSISITVFLLCLFLILPVLTNAEIITDKIPVDNQIINNQKQIASVDDKKSSIVKEKNHILPENKLIAQAKKDEEEDEQDMMDKALDLLEVADNYWENGDVENTLNVLDKAYALILDTNGDPAVARQKDDLRLLISKRIMAAYSSKQTITNGKASEIPLIIVCFDE